MFRLAVFASAMLGVSAERELLFGMPTTMEDTDAPTMAPTKWGDTEAPTAAPTTPAGYCACDTPAYPLCVPYCSNKVVGKEFSYKLKKWVPKYKKVCTTQKFCRSKYSFDKYRYCKTAKNECTHNYVAPSKPPTVAPGEGCSCGSGYPFCAKHCQTTQSGKKYCSSRTYCKKTLLPHDKVYTYCDKETKSECTASAEVPQCSCPEEFSFCVPHCYYSHGKKVCTGHKYCRGKNTKYQYCDRFNKKPQCTDSFGDSPTAFPTIAPTNTTEIEGEISEDMAEDEE